MRPNQLTVKDEMHILTQGTWMLMSIKYSILNLCDNLTVTVTLNLLMFVNQVNKINT